jgi:hypothetical protein
VLLLDAGKGVLRDEGLGAGAITFKKVFDRLEAESGIRITNASVIGRLWRNLSEFQADVLVAIARDESDVEIELTVKAVDPILSSVDLSTPEGRLSALRELCRVGSAANFQSMRQSDNWPLWISVWGAATGGEPLEHRTKIKEALVSGYDAFNKWIEEVYRAMVDILGLRLREQFTLRQFTIAVNAFGRGCGLTDRVDSSDMEGIARATGPGGTEQKWTLFGVGFEALVRQFFEPDPEWRSVVDT